MKILMAVHHFPPRYTGGAEWRAFRTARALLDRGHSVKVVAVEYIDRSDGNDLSWTDEIYEDVPVRRLAFDLARARDRFKWQYDNLWVGAHLTGMITQEQPDLFHLIGGYLISGSGIHAARQAGLPVVVTLTDYWFLCPRISMLRSDGSISTLPIDAARCARCLGEEQRRYRIPGKVNPGIMQAFWNMRRGNVAALRERMDFLMAALNQADAVICPSEFLRQTYVQAGLNPIRAHFYRQGRDFSGLTAESLQKEPCEVLRVGYLGQIASHKGVHLLVEAARRLSDLPIRFQIYGDPNHYPDYAASLKRQAGMDARIEFCGTYPRQELSRVLHALDVVVVPSMWYENSPNTILEAFAHRTAVIASNLGGMSELVKDGVNGLLFTPGDASDLASQIRRCLFENGLLGQLQSGIEPVKLASQEMDELIGVYAGLLQNGGATVADFSGGK